MWVWLKENPWNDLSRSQQNPLQFELENDYQFGCREQIIQISYRWFWIFQSKPCSMVRFGPCKVRRGGSVHCNSDSRLFRSRLVLWFKSEWRQVVWTLRLVVVGRSVTEVVTSVQPGSGFGEKSNAWLHTKGIPHMASKEFTKTVRRTDVSLKSLRVTLP